MHKAREQRAESVGTHQMKRSSPSLQFLAAAESADAAATMTFRPPYGGGRNQWRRGFADRPSGDTRDQLVSGDLHFRAVRNANRGFRPTDGGKFVHHGAFRPQPPPPYFNSRNRFNPQPPVFNSQPPFSPHPPPFDQNQPFCQPPQLFRQRPPKPPGYFNYQRPFSPHPLPFDQNQPFRPPPRQQFRPQPPKPPDYRNWEYARSGPPPQCEQFKVVSYNLLADYLAMSHRSKLYFHIPRDILDWEWRKTKIIFELGLWSADVLCFQEVDRFQDLEEELKPLGYSGIWKMRTGDPVDGCAVFWRISRFKLLHEEYIEFNKLGLRDNVAQICVLESMSQHDNKNTSAVPASSIGSSKVVICNIHVLYNPKRGDIKLGQIRVLLDRAYAVSKFWDDAPVVICGDFNCTPKSSLYNFISEQKLNLIGLPRDKVSGQASAEILPLRVFSPNLRAQSADNSVRAPTMVDGKEVRKSNFLSDTLKQNGSDSHSENLSSASGLPESRSSTTVLNVSNSCINKQHENRGSALSYEPTKETQQDASDGCKDETESTLLVPVSSFEESPSSFHDERRDSLDKIKDGSHEFNTVGSHFEDIYCNVTGTGHRENMYASFSATSSSSSKNYQLKLNAENESMNCDKGKLSLVGDSYSTEAIIDFEPARTFKSNDCSSELLQEISLSNAFEFPPRGSSGNPSSVSAANDRDFPSMSYEINVSYESTSVVDENMKNLSLNEPFEARNGGESLGEDCSSFLSELHNSNGSFASNFDQFRSFAFEESDESMERATVSNSQKLYPSSDGVLNDFPGMKSEAVNAEKTTFDPSSWTPMEIETATGSADCTLMEHPLKLRSTYAEVEDCSGTRDPYGEPLVTSYNRRFLGTVDYIWRSEGLQTVRVLAPIPKHAMQWTPGFPTKKWGSDHIALVSELAFTKDVTIQDLEAW